MTNSCWQVLLQSDAFLNWDDKEKEFLVNLIRYKGSSENIRLSDVFMTNPDKGSSYAEFFSSPVGASEYVDMRIRAIKFYNFRCFRMPDDTIPYGVAFSKNGDPCSMFLVGGNGTGKSTIYSALELHYTGFCSHAKEMGCDIKDYLTYGFNRLATIQEKDVSIGIIRQDGDGKEIKQTLNSFQPICPSSAYCSDYDVEQIRQNGKTLYLYLLRQLGYGQFEQLLQHISFLQKTIGNIEKSMQQDSESLNSAEFNEVILNFFRSVDNKSDNSKECEIYVNPECIKNEIEGSEPQHSHHLFTEQWEIARKSKIIQENSPNMSLVIKKKSENADEYNKQVELLASLYNELLKIFKYKEKLQGDQAYSDEASLLLALVKNMTERKKELEDKEFLYIADADFKKDINYKKNVLEKIRLLIADMQYQITLLFCKTFQEELSGVMKEFSEDKETYKIEMSSNSIGMKIHVPTPEGGFDADPYEYFNSFRFKLFCITLKITLAYYWMQKNRTIVPFVIDDVFNANDFKNGLNLEYFVANIYNWYNIKLMKDNKCEIPFQLIMFTHDDMMQTAFKKGFLRSKVFEGIENVSMTNNDDDYNMIYARLFPKNDIEKIREGKRIEYKNLYFDESEEL